MRPTAVVVRRLGLVAIAFISPAGEVVEEFEFEASGPALLGAMIMTTTLTATADGTDVLVVHEGVPDNVPPADKESGTCMAFDNLAKLVESTWGSRPT